MSRARATDLASRARWQRWEMDALPPPAGRQAPADEDPAPGVELLRERAEQLSRAREQGWAKGHEAGFAQGRSEGHAQGLAEGHAQGLAEGMAEGRRQGLESGAREGRALGLRAGHDEGAQAVLAQAQRLQALTESCARAIETVEAEVGQALIGLAVRIAGQVLRSRLRDDAGQITALVGELLQGLPEHDTALHLRLHPDDVALLDAWFAREPDAVRPRLVPDDAVSPGGCVLETAQGTIDATLETRWQRVIAALGRSDPLP